MVSIRFKRAAIAVLLVLCSGYPMSLAAQEAVYETPSSSGDLYAAEYKDYVRTVRYKIEDIAYKRFDVTDDGTVSLDFEVSADGNLVQYNVNDQSTDASQKIIDIAVDSLQKAAPFAPFPAAMSKRFSKLVFTIVLNFSGQKKMNKVFALVDCNSFYVSLRKSVSSCP